MLQGALLWIVVWLGGVHKSHGLWEDKMISRSFAFYQCIAWLGISAFGLTMLSFSGRLDG